MDEELRKNLEEAGWTPELIETAKGSFILTEVDQMFLDRAHAALREAGYSALDFLEAHPRVSSLELARRLNRGVSAIGLVMAIYEDATRKGALRTTAKDLLIRKIHEEFPQGWNNGGIGPALRIGSWDFEIEKYTQSPEMGKYAAKIINQLTIDHVPAEGWKPQFQADPIIDDLFDRYWPIEPKPQAQPK